jgi:hypothetical protein
VKSADCPSTGGKSGKKLGRSKILQRKMPKKQKINILWFTKDLRTRDSESLYNAMQEELPFLAVYVFDSEFFAQKQFGSEKSENTVQNFCWKV